MTYIEGFLSVYIHVLALGSPDQVVLDFCRKYQVTFAQVHPFLWRIVQATRYFANKAEIEFTLSHLVKLYRPLRYRGLIALQCCSTRAPVIGSEEDEDCGWINRFVRIRTTDVMPGEFLSFPEKCNSTRKCFV